MPPSKPQPHTHSADLELIADAPPETPLPEEEAAAEDAHHRERETLELEKSRLVNRDLRQNTEERKRYATKLFRVMVAWLVAVAYVVLAQGFGRGFPIVGGAFHLADSVVIALITTTTATVIGAFLTVANYLFPRRDSSK